MSQMNIPITQPLPEWATNPGRTAEPGQTDKELGNVAGTKAVARWDNWFKNNAYKWAKVALINALRSWNDLVINPSGTIDSVVYHPVLEIWIATQSATNFLRLSAKGHTWADGIALPGGLDEGMSAIDSVRYIYGTNSTGDVRYTADPAAGSFTTATGSIFPASEAVSAIETKYPTSDNIMAGGQEGALKYASAVTGTFAATTAPAYTGAATGGEREIRRILPLAGNGWLIITAIGEVFITTDNGATWTKKTDVTGAGTSNLINHAVISDETGRIIVSGNFSTGLMYYSDDSGTTWVAADSERYNMRMYYCGGGIVFGRGDGVTPSNFSVDNGETWVTDKTILTDAVVNDIGCDGKKLIVAGSAGDGAITFNVVT